MNTAADAALLARVTLSLLVVVLLAVIGARLARRTVLRGHGRNLQVLERLPLSREASLAVVSVAGRGLVLGVTAQGVRVLSELDGETLAQAYPEPEAGAVAGPGRRPSRAAGRAGVARGSGGVGKAGKVGRAGKVGKDGVAAVRVGPDGVTVTRLTDDDPPVPRGTGTVLDPRTWRQAVQAVRDLTVRRG
jgi:flagellar biogenesis protein FliO